MIWADVSSYISQPSCTGIQRVVAEILSRIVRKASAPVFLLHYDSFNDGFDILDEEQVYECLEKGHKELDYSRCNFVSVDDFRENDLFFDLDSQWDLVTPKRTTLYPKLKSRGVFILSYIYDITPVLDPRLTDLNIVKYFSYYLGAVLAYADAIMSETESGIREVNALRHELGLESVPGYATWLGCDFSNKKDMVSFAPDDMLQKATARPFVLMVGTLQPLKNHQVILDAFDKGLFARGLNLVMAGKIGWDVDELVSRIKSHPLLDKQLFLLTKLDDASIDYLYRKAFCLAFSTLREGFGLPTVEALQHGTPVLASNLPVLQEVGGDFCRYFEPHSAANFIDVITPLLDSKEEYQAFRKKAASYKAVGWNEVADKVLEVLRRYHPGKEVRPLSRPERLAYAKYEVGEPLRPHPSFNGLLYDIVGTIWTYLKVVRIPLEVQGELDGLFLAIHCSPFLINQSVEITANGLPLGKTLLCGNSNIQYRIPRHYFGAHGKLLMQLSLPDATSPLEHNLSQDRRMLGLLLTSFKIEKAEKVFEVNYGERLFFGNDLGAGAQRFFLYGLSYIERDYAWTDGQTVKMCFYVGRTHRKAVTLSINCKTFLPQERVVVYANRRRVAKLELEGPCDFTVRIPASRIDGRGLLTVHLVLLDAKSPADIGLSADKRKLGLRFHSLVVN